MTARKPSKKAANEAWTTLRELLNEFPTGRTRTWVEDQYEYDGPKPTPPKIPASFQPTDNYRSFNWNRSEEGRAAGEAFKRALEAWEASARLVIPRHADFGARPAANLLAPLLVAVARDQFDEIPLFAISQSTPEQTPNTRPAAIWGPHPFVGAGCSLFTEVVSIIVQDCEPLVWRPRPRTQFDRDLDRAMVDQDSLEVTDHKIVVVDRPEPVHINLLATTWRDPNYKHQPYWRKGVITMTSSQLRMGERTFFITGRNLKVQAEKYGATHRMYFSHLWWDDGPTSYTRTRKALKEWVLAERDRFYDAALVMVKDGWLQRNLTNWEW